MRDIFIPLAEYTKDSIFSPIRQKKDFIMLLVNAISYVQTTVEISRAEGSYLKIVKNGKVTRFIFVSENKVFSVAIPFHVTVSSDNGVIFKCNGIDIDSEILYGLKSIFGGEYNDLNYYSVYEKIEDLNFDSEDIWDVLNSILMAEEGYLRFDHDPGSQNGRTHPLNHLDIFYSNNSSLKIGTYTPPCPEFLFDMIKFEGEKKYIEK